jgi:hypothetical protein
MVVNDDRLIAQYILSYLQDNPKANDTIEGIVEWWILQEKIKHRMQGVRKVVDALVAENVLVAYTSKDLKTHYRINSEKMDEIRARCKPENK